MFADRLENIDDPINLPLQVESPLYKKEYTGEVIYEENEKEDELENTDAILEKSSQK
jgi:hypothetical protein